MIREFAERVAERLRSQASAVTRSSVFSPAQQREQDLIYAIADAFQEEAEMMMEPPDENSYNNRRE